MIGRKPYSVCQTVHISNVFSRDIGGRQIITSSMDRYFCFLEVKMKQIPKCWLYQNGRNMLSNIEPCYFFWSIVFTDTVNHLSESYVYSAERKDRKTISFLKCIGTYIALKIVGKSSYLQEFNYKLTKTLEQCLKHIFW